MQPNQILTADLLDILFDGKNKEYGAYQLRKNYDKRMMLSMLSMLLLVSVPIAVWLNPWRKNKPAMGIYCSGPIVDLPQVDTVMLIPPPPVAKSIKHVKTIHSATIAVVPDDDFKEEQKPPTSAELEENVKIGLTNSDGDLTDVIAPPENGLSEGSGKGIENGTGTDNNTGMKNFIPISIESEYPGGSKAWMLFLNRMLGGRYPSEAFEKGIQGTVVIQFLVDVDGSVSNIEAISGPAELREAAINTIRKSGKWHPAIQNHRSVKTYKRQPITFVLQG